MINLPILSPILYRPLPLDMACRWASLTCTGEGKWCQRAELTAAFLAVQFAWRYGWRWQLMFWLEDQRLEDYEIRNLGTRSFRKEVCGGTYQNRPQVGGYLCPVWKLIKRPLLWGRLLGGDGLYCGYWLASFRSHPSACWIVLHSGKIPSA